MMSVSSIRVKLLVNKTTGKVLYAEASDEFVDLLFTVLAMPVNLLADKNMVGALGNLCASLDSTRRTFLQYNANKDTLSMSKLVSTATTGVFLFHNVDWTPLIFMCNNKRCPYTVNITSTIPCPTCNENMTFQSPRPSGPSGSVPGVVSYMVQDDLTVSPLSTISSLTVLNQFNIKEVSSIEEKNVFVGTTEALQLLKTSVYSKTVLSDVFLKTRTS